MNKQIELNQKIALTRKGSKAQHTVLQSLFWHILPGGLTTLAFFLLRPFTAGLGYPPLLAFLLAILLVDLPVMVGIMVYIAHRENGRFSFSSVIVFQEKVTWPRFLLGFVVAFTAVYLLIILLTPLNNLLAETVFSGLPAWLLLEDPSQYEAFPRNVLLVVFGLQLILTGIVLPWIEELYFRGFLLPRLSHSAMTAPLLGGLFFALYHVWQPQGFLTVFLLGVALSVVAWRTRDIRLPVALHIFANLLPRLAILLTAFALPVS